MSDAPIVGSAAFELRATRKKLGEDLKASERDLKAAMGQIESEADRGVKSIGASFGKLTRGLAFGFTAVAAAAAAGLAIALQFGKASLKMADDLANSSRRIGIGTDALQEWRYVARKTGEDSNAVSADLEKFATKFAQAQAGISASAMKPFARLGFSQDELRGMKDADEALEKTMDRILALQSAGDRQAITDQFGLASLASAAREGSEEIDRLRGEAAALGFVMDAELIQKGSEAQDQLDDLSQIIGIQMASAFINLSDEVLEFTGHIADAITALSNFIDRAQVAKRVSGFGMGDALGVAATPMGLVRGLWKAGRFAVRGPNVVNTDALEDLAAGTGRHAPPRPQRIPRGAPDLADLPSRSRKDHSAQREARRAERVQEEIERLKVREFQIAQDDLLTVQQMYDLKQRELEAERAAEDANLKSRLARKDLNKAEFEQLTSQNIVNRGLEDRIAKDLLARDLDDERLARERMLSDLTVELLSLQSSAARTAKERRDLELRLLAIAQQKAREDLERDLARKPDLSDADKEAQRAALKSVQDAQRQAVNRQTMGPLEQWRDQSLKTAGEIREAYENVAARGLDALNDGIVDAIMNSKDLGETFSNVARQILADLLAISVRRGVTEPLERMLFGGGQPGATSVAGSVSGAGNWIKKAINLGRGLFGFSEGGYTGEGGKHEPAGIVHRGEYVFSQEVVKRIGAMRLEAMHQNLKGFSSGGLVGMSLPALSLPGGGGSVAKPQRVYVEVGVNDDRFNAYVDGRSAPMAMQAGQAALSGARSQVPADIARNDRYTRSRR